MKKEEQIRMLLHPEKYTDEQLDQMLDEVNIPVPDANSEWMRYKKKRSGFPILKIAASIIGVLMLSGIAYATIAHFIEIGEKPNTVITERKTEIDKVEKAYGMEVVPTKNAPVEFNNVELQQIMKYVSDNYNCSHHPLLSAVGGRQHPSGDNRQDQPLRESAPDTQRRNHHHRISQQ